MKRVTMQARTAAAIAVFAAEHGAYAAPVITNRGTVDEVFVYAEGRLQASIFRPEPGRLAVLRMTEGSARAVMVPDVAKAVERALRGVQKQQLAPAENG